MSSVKECMSNIEKKNEDQTAKYICEEGWMVKRKRKLRLVLLAPQKLDRFKEQKAINIWSSMWKLKHE